jgi:site-specific DNA recombinase
MDGFPQQDEQIGLRSADTQDDLDAAIYARTSSSSQKFGYSIDEQVTRCWNQCEVADWTVQYVFTDEAESGRDTERPQFQRMLDRAEEGTIDVVIFWKLDRFCRSLADLVRIEDKLSDWDVALQSVTEYIDTTSPVGRFNFRNLASAAELESDLTSQRTQMGMYGLAQDHKWPNEHPPLGYTKTDEGKLEIDEQEAELVRYIFRLYTDLKSMPKVAVQLNDKGATTKTDDEWCRQSIKKVLSNGLYVGEYEVAGYQEYVQEYRIVEDDLFEAVEDVRYRFQRSREQMSEDRKQSKTSQVLSAYKSRREHQTDDAI